MLKLANTIVNMAQPFSEYRAAELEVLRGDIVNTTSAVPLETLISKISFLSINLRVKDVITAVRGLIQKLIH